MSASSASVSDEISKKWEVAEPARDQVPSSAEQIDTHVSMPMWSFASDGARLLCDRPVEVRFHVEDGSFFASCDRLHIFSSGSSYQECIRDIHYQVVHFYENYTSLGDDDVVGLGVQLRELYLNHFSKLN